MATHRLSDNQLVILSTAAKHDSGRILPTPPSLKANGRALRRILSNLVKRDFIAEIAAHATDEEWRQTDAGERLTLAITESGLTAIGLSTETASAEVVATSADEAQVPVEAGLRKPKDNGANARTATASDATKAMVGASSSYSVMRKGTKGVKLVQLLRREAGTDLAELMDASGWQQHSVREFQSGALKKKHGLVIESDQLDDQPRRYRIAV